MTKKRSTNSVTWEWRESRTVKRLDELRWGERSGATLRWEGLFSKRAYAQTAEGQWTFDRPRLLSRDVEVWAGDQLVAVHRTRWTGEGTLEFADGHAYDWAPTNFWQTRWAFFGADDTALIGFDDTSRLFEYTAAVTYWASDLPAADSALLTALGHYLMVLSSTLSI